MCSRCSAPAWGVIVALVAASPLLAHHDWPVDRTRQITVTGTVTAFIWADPHVTIALDVQANGTIEKWKLGGSSKKNSEVNGWNKNETIFIVDKGVPPERMASELAAFTIQPARSNDVRPSTDELGRKKCARH